MPEATGHITIRRAAKSGQDGKDGARGRMLVPYGKYDKSTTYTATDIIAPYVLFQEQYYVMNKNGMWLGIVNLETPKSDYEKNGDNATWILMPKYKAMYVELLMADFGKIASAIFFADLQFSQHGTIDGVASEEYERILLDKDGNIYEGKNNFIPNFWVNFKTGKMHAQQGVFDGDVTTKFVPIEKYADYDESSGYTITDHFKLRLFNMLMGTAIGTMKVTLPRDSKYIGRTVTLMDSAFPPYSKMNLPAQWTIQVADGGYIQAAKNVRVYQDVTLRETKFINFYGGIVELLAYDDGSGKCGWMLTSYRAVWFKTTEQE